MIDKLQEQLVSKPSLGRLGSEASPYSNQFIHLQAEKDQDMKFLYSVNQEPFQALKNWKDQGKPNQ